MRICRWWLGRGCACFFRSFFGRTRPWNVCHYWKREESTVSWPGAHRLREFYITCGHGSCRFLSYKQVLRGFAWKTVCCFFFELLFQRITLLEMNFVRGKINKLVFPFIRTVYSMYCFTQLSKSNMKWFSCFVPFFLDCTNVGYKSKVNFWILDTRLVTQVLWRKWIHRSKREIMSETGISCLRSWSYWMGSKRPASVWFASKFRSLHCSSPAARPYYGRRRKCFFVYVLNYLS